MRGLLTAIAATGCASITPIDAPYGAATCAEWAVPAEGGLVVTCSAERVVVRFPGKQLDPIAEKWRIALIGEGWEIAKDAGTAASPAMLLQRGDERLVLGVVAQGGSSLATVARAP
ncbi:MAG: hypothetical protein H0V89_02815 [Deltaproteobacteria bacterium]|nr:hypothetical protein [Deltaproteobacteria bacterium]